MCRVACQDATHFRAEEQAADCQFRRRPASLAFSRQLLAFSLQWMIGTALNVAGILIGGVTGLVRRKPLSPANESFFKVGLGVFTVFYGLRLTWISVNGTFLQVLKQLLIAVLALMLGKMT